MRYESAPIPFGFHETPSGPYDPPQPAPQAKAWRLALKVVGCAPPRRQADSRTTSRRIKSMRPIQWS